MVNPGALRSGLTRNNSTGSDLGTSADFKTELKELNVGMKEMYRMYEELSKKIDEVRSLAAKVTTLEGDIARLTADNAKKDEVIGDLVDRIQHLEQYTRKDSIEIREVPEAEGESVPGLVVKIAEKLNIPLSAADISASHRLKPYPGRSTGIIVKFVSRAKREAFLANRKTVVTKSDVVPGYVGEGRIYINESLSRFNKNLMWKAKLWANRSGYKYVWWAGGVRIRRDVNARFTVIKSEGDLEKLPRYPAHRLLTASVEDQQPAQDQHLAVDQERAVPIDDQQPAI